MRMRLQSKKTAAIPASRRIKLPLLVSWWLRSVIHASWHAMQLHQLSTTIFGLLFGLSTGFSCDLRSSESDFPKWHVAVMSSLPLSPSSLLSSSESEQLLLLGEVAGSWTLPMVASAAATASGVWRSATPKSKSYEQIETNISTQSDELSNHSRKNVLQLKNWRTYHLNIFLFFPAEHFNIIIRSGGTLQCAQVHQKGE